MENKNDWYERGELPPVGTVCELLPYWHVCESIAPHRDGMVMYNRGEDAYFLATKNTRFRPPKTERDRRIETAPHVIGEQTGGASEPIGWAVAALLDAGMFKMPEDKQ